MKGADMTTKKKKDLVEEIHEIVEADHTKEKFSAAAFVKGGGAVLPEMTLEIFVHQAAAFRITKIDNEILEIFKKYEGNLAGPPESETKPLTDERDRLAQELWDTRMIFHMRGLAPKLAKAIDRKIISSTDKDDPLAQSDALMIERLRHVIRKIEVPGEGVDEGPWDTEQMRDIYDGLPLSEQGKLQYHSDALSFGVQLSDRRSDAGFLGGGDDMASES